MRLRDVAAPTIAVLLFARAASAVTIDGRLDAGYGTARVTQTTQTQLNNAGQITGDNTANDLNDATGSELDEAYAQVSNGVLYLFLTGNLAMEPTISGNSTVGHTLDIFFDTVAGGQGRLTMLGTGNPINGFTFDSGFAADYYLELIGDAVGGVGKTPIWRAGYGTLATAGGGTFTDLGWSLAGGPGTLSGGTNPYGIQVSIDNHNIAGVTLGCNASSGAGVTTGIEWAIPLAAIGSPTGCFKVTAVVRADASTGSMSPMSNSMLGPAPVGTCPPGPISMVDLSTLAGDQFFTICPTTTGVSGPARARFALLGAVPNPLRGGPVMVAFELPDTQPARLQMVDASGRVVRERQVVAAAGGLATADLSPGPRLAAGIYWLRLQQGARSVTRRLSLLR